MNRLVVGVSVLALLVLTTAVLFAQSPNASGQKVKIVFWDENAGPTRTPYYEELIKRFQASQNEVEVEYVGLPPANALDKYNIAIAANETPDVGGINLNYIPGMVAKKALTPMDPWFNTWNQKGKIIPSIIASARNIVPDGKLYFMPSTSALSCFWYRTDLFKAQGLSYPETWDQFFNAVHKLTNKEKRQYGYTIRGGAQSAAVLIDLMYSYSGITYAFDAKGKSSVNDPRHVEFVKKYLGLYKTYTPESDITASVKEITANFDTGVAALLFHNLGSGKDHLKAFGNTDKFAAGPVPKSVQGYRAINPVAFTGYMIFQNSKHKDAAWKWVSFLASAASNSYWNESIGQMPVNTDVLKDDWVNKSQHIKMALTEVADPKTRTFGIPVQLPDYSVINAKFIEPDIQKILLGEMTVEKMLADWAGALEKAKKNFDQGQTNR